MTVAAIIARVRSALDQLGADSSLEEVVHHCPEITWNQVVFALYYLSQTREVRVTLGSDGTYKVRAHRAIAVAASPAAPAP